MNFESDTDDLRTAFENAFTDLCRDGLAKPDPAVLASLWFEFLADMAAGFPSLFKTARPQ